MSRRSSQRQPKRIPGPVVFGLFLMGIGAVALAHNLGLLGFEAMWRLWPALFIFGGLVGLVNDGPLSTGAHVKLAAGTVLLAGFNDYAPEAERFWPLALVWVGLVLLLKALRPKPLPEPLPPTDSVPQDDASRNS